MFEPLDAVLLQVWGVLGLAVICWLGIRQWKNRERRWALLFPVIGMVVILGAWFHYRIKINPVYEVIYNESKDSLGHPRSAATFAMNDGADQEQFQKALVLWFHLQSYILWDQPGNRLDVLPGTTQQSPDDPHLLDKDFWRQQLGLPSNCVPPTGSLGVAERDYTWLPKVGCQESQCTYDNGVILFQKFDNGIIVGPFRHSASKVDNRGIIFTLLTKENVWKSTEVDQSPPLLVGQNECHSP